MGDGGQSNDWVSYGDWRYVASEVKSATSASVPGARQADSYRSTQCETARRSVTEITLARPGRDRTVPDYPAFRDARIPRLRTGYGTVDDMLRPQEVSAADLLTRVGRKNQTGVGGKAIWRSVTCRTF
jgi:hypothetical protein